MGERDGLQLIREAMAAGCRTPIVFLTAESAQRVDIEAMNAGAFDYLVKGEITPRMVERSLRYALKLGETLEELRRLATRDQLTGLLNRRELDRILEEERERAVRFGHTVALVMVDIDHFEAVNDTHGHLVGDTVLQEVARRLNTQVRTVDRVARFGGEEFGIVLVHANREAAMDVANRVCAAVRQDVIIVHDDLSLAITVSAGVAILPEDAENEIALVNFADKALYAAKSSGRNQAVAYKKPWGRFPERWRPDKAVDRRDRNRAGLSGESRGRWIGRPLAHARSHESEESEWRRSLTGGVGDETGPAGRRPAGPGMLRHARRSVQSLLGRGHDPEAGGLDLEYDVGAGGVNFAVGLDQAGGAALDREPGAEELRDAGGAGQSAGKETREQRQSVPQGKFGNRHEIEEAVVDPRRRSDAGVVTVLSRVGDREGEGPDGMPFALRDHDQFLGFTVPPGDESDSEIPGETAAAEPVEAFGDRGLERQPGDAHEGVSVGEAGIDGPGDAGFEHAEDVGERPVDAEVAAEPVTGTAGDETQGRAGADQRPGDFVHGAIAADCDDEFEAFCDSLGG